MNKFDETDLKYLNSAQGILDKHLHSNFDDAYTYNSCIISAMKEYAEYIAKCAHRDLRYALVEKFLEARLAEASDFDSLITNHQFVKPKELE